ncbi:lipase family protein [Sphingomonas sp. PL-96]|uniref:lipase family protein n=1 Tax=Sphingomonas sp. PL-96 TaxID=2887201 RepID=UPI001E5765F0|nr:lipase family protein [Sphingomonas sp. PL-96]MCC2978313.1 lipase family protein [Sphingomonas sp. PL-96]
MLSHFKRHVAAVAASALPLASVPVQAQSDRWAGDGGLPPFYHWTKPVTGRPGRILRSEPAPATVSIPAAGRAERILYSSSDWREPSRRIPVSGVVFFPKGTPPKGGWPLIAWAHGTTGIADVCAPSSLPRSERDATYFRHWLDAGYAIVATDYQGLGTPGVHPYLHYEAEGIDILDGIRAAIRAYPELSRDKILTMGQSQGSEGAIAAAYLAPRYAPELKIRGTVATGIVAETANPGKAPQAAVPTLYANAADYGNTAYEILWFLGTARSMDPGAIRPEDYISDAGQAMAQKAQSSCMSGLRSYAAEIRLPYAKFYKRPIDALERRVFASTRFPDTRITTPVFIGMGLADSEAQPAKQYNFVSAMCAAGTRVEFHYYPGATHGSAVLRSLADSPAFVDKVMNGAPAPGNCADLTAPGPLQQPDQPRAM